MDRRRRKAYRDRITVQQKVTTRDTSGQVIISDWTDVPGLAGLPASWNHTAGTEVFRGHQLEARVVGVFEIRKPPVTISTQYRVIYLSDESQPFGIVSVRPAETVTEGGFKYEYIMVEAFGK